MSSKSHALRCLTLFIAVCYFGAAFAESNQPPDIGYLSNGKNFIEFKCDQPTKQGMMCRFEQILITPKAGPKELSKALSEVPKILKEISQDKGMAETCKSVQQMSAAMRSPPPYNVPEVSSFMDKWSDLSEKERSDARNDIDTLAKVCGGATKENVEAMLRWQNTKDSKTCTLWLNSYEQTFTQQSVDVWVHNSQPEGLCGVINTSTIERQSGTLWTYRTRKFVTNKNATKDNKIFSCKSVDESEQTYSTTVQPLYKGCEYITLF